MLAMSPTLTTRPLVQGEVRVLETRAVHDSVLAKLRELQIPALGVDLRHNTSRGQILVLVTLQRSHNLNALFAAERFLAPLVSGERDHLAVPMTSGAGEQVEFFWRYLPQVRAVGEAA